MGYFTPFLLLVLALVSFRASAAPLEGYDYSVDEDFSLEEDCVHSPTDRQCWGNYSIDTDYYNEWPITGRTVEYWIELVNTTAAPDGFSRQVLLVNGSFPGPTIYANWGDTIKLHVKNSLQNNGTGIHFHGVRQYLTNEMDGATSITQCPAAPGDHITYTWHATQYGTSWYHSHFGLQAWEGVLGGIIINGPSSDNYDEDLGVLFLNDWTHRTAHELYEYAATTGPPLAQNGLLNGTNVSKDGGKRLEMSFTPGKKHKIRLINAAIDTHFRFSIDGHTMTVVAMDFVPIVPYTTDVLAIAMGQRYDVIIEAKAAPTNYWIRAVPQAPCSINESKDNIKGIVRYVPSIADPVSVGHISVENCDDEPANKLVPYVSKQVGTKDTGGDLPVTVGKIGNFYKWYMNYTTIMVKWANPTLLRIVDGVSTWDNVSAVIELPEEDEWAYFIIETDFAAPHPIHLHGHDFFVLAQGIGKYDRVRHQLNTNNPPRRDTATLPASGFLVIAFEADNPGAWLMHCHIGWHIPEGFALQFVEQHLKIPAITDVDRLKDNCITWQKYQEEAAIVEEDSGV